ncbi:MAG: FdhF/YdeP family oxidoreductase [Deltaproteobacteria bacterium]|nr:FdhF/YdeP family oxidoreductase [Deltaproteobacteria bacterium]
MPAIRGAHAAASWRPFGLGLDKPHHILETAEVVWENRDALPYAWNILNEGVCDGCSLGPRGLRDDVIAGTHVCTSRLKLLRINTMGPLAPADLLDIDRLRGMSNAQLQRLGRLPYPFIYRRGDRGFRRISWDDAYGLARDRLREVDPRRLAFFATSKGVTNEVYYALTKAARLLGTNHVDLCARLCHAATVAGLSRTIGVAAPTCSLSDLIGTDLILLIGTNLSNNQPVSMKYLMEAKRKGTRIVVVNTTLEKGLERYWVPSDPRSALFGTTLMDDFIQVNAGGDIGFLNGVLKALIERGAVNLDYVNGKTEGFAEAAAAVAAQRWEDLEAVAGCRRRDIEWFAELLTRAQSFVTVYSMGLTQHRWGVQNVEAVANLHLATGTLGRPKCGILPIRGHSGVQGGGEIGVAPNKLPGGRTLTEETAAEMSAIWGHPIPTWKGLTTGPMVEAAHRGELDLLYNLGGNLLATMPDPQFVVEAFANTPVRVHQDIVVNTSMLLEPKEFVLLLPAQTRYEQKGGGTSTSTERRIRFSPEVTGHPQVGEARPEYQIIAQFARALRPALGPALDYTDSAIIRDEMERAMPMYRGISTLKRAGDWVQWGGPLLCTDFHTMPNKRARFTPTALPDNAVPPGHFWLSTRRGKQFNSIIIKDIDRLQGGEGRDDLFMNPADMRRLGVAANDRVRLRSALGHWDARVRPMNIKPGVLAAYWPECNGIIERRYDPCSEQPDFNAIVTVEKL